MSFLLVGCSDSGSEGETQGGTNASEMVEENKAANTASDSEAAQISVPGNDNVVRDEVSVSAPKAGLNPPHGQPGHDCAVAVGAPLDGSGGQAPPANVSTSLPEIQPNLNVSAPTSGNLNPPHGQPGHDCAVAVGAPLPSK